MEKQLTFSNILEQIKPALPSDKPIYLVGGAVRDKILGRDCKDYDFAVHAGSLETGRQVANLLGAAYYPLDETRQTARVVLVENDGSRFFLDFVLLRGPDLETDLRSRDFTINSLAIEVGEPDSLLDPLGGLADLHKKILRSSSASAFVDDPLRILRGVRLAAALNYRIIPDTQRQMREAVNRLELVSPERLRDELIQILAGPQPATAIRALDMLGALQQILPELQQLKGLSQSPPHVREAWSHTLDTLAKLEIVLDVLSNDYRPDSAANLMMGLVSIQLGRYREEISAHLCERVTPDRQIRALLFLAALYHDAGKFACQQVDEQGRIRYLGHEAESSRLVKKRGRALHLSSEEVDRLERIVGAHMRPIQLSQTKKDPSRKAIYRYFRDLEQAGVDVCLLSMADTLATYGTTLAQDYWSQHVHVIRQLLEAWWEKQENYVSPPDLLRGSHIIETFQIEPGPIVGRVLEAVREAQAIGEVDTFEEALEYARCWLEREKPKS